MSGKAAKAVATPRSSSYALRYLGTLKQPDAASDLELDESDVVWSSSWSSSSAGEEPDSPAYGGGGGSPSAPICFRGRSAFTTPRYGLSILLGDDESPGAAASAGLVVRQGIVRSAPMKVPAWPEREERRRAVEEEEGEGMVPPHVIVARLHVTRSSVFEGAGRTLKGWDLFRVRTTSLLMTGYIQKVNDLLWFYRRV
ncbi:protein S40-4-like [Typha latifolia]|uniref:protein S40-4-like n=1 Tax=Typha latifolia TaxID=4733 RepID=UPI003C309DCA